MRLSICLYYIFIALNAQFVLAQSSGNVEQYRFETLPFGADVVLKDGGEEKILGSTPLVFEGNLSPNASITFRKLGYKSAQMVIDRTVFSQKMVILEQEALPTHLSVKQWLKPRPQTWWADALAGAVVVAGGAYSVHNKFKADAIYDDYAKTGDPLLRPSMKRFDTRAGWGLAAAETGLAFITLRLVLR